MIRALLSRLKGELALSLMRTFVARGIAAVGGVLLFVVLGRLYGAEGVGVFALAQSIYLGAGILARYGMDNALMRYVGQDPTSSAVPVYLRWALIKSALLSTTAAVLVFLLRDQFALWFNAPMLGIVLPGIALAIPPFTVAFVLAGFMKGIRKPATACLLENGGIALVATALVLLFYDLSSKGISTSGWAIAGSAWLLFAYGLAQAWRHCRASFINAESARTCFKAFNSSSHAFFVMSLASFIEYSLFLFVASLFLSEVDVGLFKAAERIALIISFLLYVVNSVFPPRFAVLFKSGDMLELSLLARKACVFSSFLALPFFLICLVKPTFMLSICGDGFDSAAPMLQIIACGQMVNVATGSVGFLLNMTGHEKLMRNISLISNLLGVCLLVVLAKHFDGLGAAIALCVMLIVKNTLACYYVLQKLRISTIPFGWRSL